MVFFAIVGVIHDQHLFAPVMHFVLALEGQTQLAAYYAANGLLSMISDNVFVATVYISETKMHFEQLLATVPGVTDAVGLMDKLTDPHLARTDVIASLPAGIQDQVSKLMTHFDHLAVAINTGTNIPSVATPNGQAAFLFLLTLGAGPGHPPVLRPHGRPGPALHHHHVHHRPGRHLLLLLVASGSIKTTKGPAQQRGAFFLVLFRTPGKE